jgi:ankyrin repeat protein
MAASIGGHISCIEMLIARGADVNAKDNNGDTALSHTNDVGNDDIVNFLKQHGAI